MGVRGRTQDVTLNLETEARGSVLGGNYREVRKDTVGTRNEALVPFRKGKPASVTEV